MRPSGSSAVEFGISVVEFGFSAVECESSMVECESSVVECGFSAVECGSFAVEYESSVVELVRNAEADLVKTAWADSMKTSGTDTENSGQPAGGTEIINHLSGMEDVAPSSDVVPPSRTRCEEGGAHLDPPWLNSKDRLLVSPPQGNTEVGD